jgi:hypothetical protein
MKKKYMTPLSVEEEVLTPFILDDVEISSENGGQTGGTSDDEGDLGKERRGLWSDSDNGGSLW